MKELPKSERPYEKLELYGEKTLSNAELLDITNTLSLVGQESLSVNEIQLKLANLNLSKNANIIPII